MASFLRLLGLAAAIGLTAPSFAQSPNKFADQTASRAQRGNLVGHGGPVKAIRVTTDGNRALTGSFDYTAILWDVSGPDPKILHRLRGHNGAVNAVAFVGASRALTAGDDSLVRLWDLQSGTEIHAFEGHDKGSKIVGLDVSDDGNWAVSAGWDRTARLWNLFTLKAGGVLSEHTGPVNAAVLSRSELDRASPRRFGGEPDVYTASYDGQIRFFDGQSGSLLRRVHSAGQSVNVLARLASGKVRWRFVGGGGHVYDHTDPLLFGTVSGHSGIVDGETGNITRTFPEVARPILALADGTSYRFGQAKPEQREFVAVGGGDGKIRVFDMADGTLDHEAQSAFGPTWALAFGTHVDRGGDATALYHAGLDDVVTHRPLTPRAAFDQVDTSNYPRRFQITGKSDDRIAKGEIQFARKCSVCHTLTPDGANRAGPTLHNIFGRRIATLPGYPYSPELKLLDIVWTSDTISKLFELGPDKFTPGSKMPLQVLTNQTERDDLVAFLQRATRDGPSGPALPSQTLPIDAGPTAPQKKP